MGCRRVVHEAIRRNQEGTASTTLTADALGTNPIHRTRVTRKPAVSKPSYHIPKWPGVSRLGEPSK